MTTINENFYKTSNEKHVLNYAMAEKANTFFLQLKKHPFFLQFLSTLCSSFLLIKIEIVLIIDSFYQYLLCLDSTLPMQMYSRTFVLLSCTYLMVDLWPVRNGNTCWFDVELIFYTWNMQVCRLGRISVV